MTRDLPFDDDDSGAGDHAGETAYRVANGVARVARAGAYVTGGALVASNGSPAPSHESHDSSHFAGWAINDPHPDAPSPVMSYPDPAPNSVPPQLGSHGPTSVAAPLPAAQPLPPRSGGFGLPELDGTVGAGAPSMHLPPSGTENYDPNAGEGVPGIGGLPTLDDSTGSNAPFGLPGSEHGSSGFGLPSLPTHPAHGSAESGLPGADGHSTALPLNHGLGLPGTNGLSLPGMNGLGAGGFGLPDAAGQPEHAFHGVGGGNPGVFLGTEVKVDAHVGLDGIWVTTEAKVDFAVGDVGDQLDDYSHWLGSGVNHLPTGGDSQGHGSTGSHSQLGAQSGPQAATSGAPAFAAPAGTPATPGAFPPVSGAPGVPVLAAAPAAPAVVSAPVTNVAVPQAITAPPAPPMVQPVAATPLQTGPHAAEAGASPIATVLPTHVAPLVAVPAVAHADTGSTITTTPGGHAGRTATGEPTTTGKTPTSPADADKSSTVPHVSVPPTVLTKPGDATTARPGDSTTGHTGGTTTRPGDSGTTQPGGGTTHTGGATTRPGDATDDDSSGPTGTTGGGSDSTRTPTTTHDSDGGTTGHAADPTGTHGSTPSADNTAPTTANHGTAPTTQQPQPTIRPDGGETGGTGTHVAPVDPHPGAVVPTNQVPVKPVSHVVDTYDHTPWTGDHGGLLVASGGDLSTQLMPDTTYAELHHPVLHPVADLHMTL
ncbi:hypothetical protein ACFYTQ_31280 [Nocardia sp. NPDC004068]|uniref:hypothetical protein n=1 Tax=Nocardia sp. NPDC004068 TaxID=3364303 RepID=UPI0036A71D72